MFSIGQIVVSALVGALLSVVLALVHARWSKSPIVPWGQGVAVAVVVGISILFWRLAGNVAPLNDDPMPLVSPNDVLCPAITYVFLGVYAGLRGIADQPHWASLRAALTILSLVVNVATI